ncbi:MAG TPA: DUF2845 domain-containing protein [Smithellaceae bacterium]|nr:DUF2845 domain-containing protein [Smithellaceae bacterium]HRS88624.1 DUF2845 domain-containing protein [Smithellaceae bacterium]HRV25904.1 DUF2845 domain-containing protein [Smithellaceae bacterium]
MIRYFILVIFFLVVSVSFSLAFRCGLELVTTGDSKKQVQKLCGKPSLVETACADDEVIVLSKKKNKAKKCRKKAELWHYNCGEGDFIYILTFEKGVLTKETTAGRGHGSSECAGNK